MMGTKSDLKKGTPVVYVKGNGQRVKGTITRAQHTMNVYTVQNEAGATVKVQVKNHLLRPIHY